jgi:hypothetical protein
MALDLSSGTWEKLGKSDSTDFITLAVTPWGMYVNNTAIIDLKTNKKYVLSNSLKKDWETHVLRSTGSHDLDIVYAIDSTIYFGDFSSRLDSIQFRRQDLIEMKEAFYVAENPEKSGSNMMWITAIAVMVISPVIAHTVWRKKKKKSIATPDVVVSKDEKAETQLQDPPTYRSTIQANMLDEQETLLLSFILEQSKKSELTSIEQLNQLLGLSNRTGEVQKRTRSILITGINEKLQILLGSMEPIIEKKRSEFDKRSYEYYISPNLFGFIKEVLNNVNKDSD